MPSLPEIGSSLPEVVLRTAIVYLFLVGALRLSGKREVGQMSVLELIVILVISDAVQNSMVGDNTTLLGGLVAVVTLLTLDFSLKALSRRSKRCATSWRASRGCWSATADCSTKAIEEEGLEVEEVRAAVRSHGLARVEDVRLAVLETDGSISVIPRDEGAPTSNRPPADDRRT